MICLLCSSVFSYIYIYLSLISDFKGFAGGLNTKQEGVTGTHSYHTRFRAEIEIMFHVSTLLPHQETDAQRIEKKRHLGNDIVVMIFIDGPTENFNPASVVSDFNTVFAVVTPDPDSPTDYRLAFAYNDQTAAAAPYLFHPAVLEGGVMMRDFLLTKLINAEIAALAGPHYQRRLESVKNQLLRDLVDNAPS